MSKEPNYTFKEGRKKSHLIRFTKLGVTVAEYFYNKKEAIAFRNEAMDVFEKMSAALAYMDAENYKGRLSMKDTEILYEDVIDFDAAGLTGLRRKIVWLNSEFRGQGEYEDNLNPTVSQIISAYLEERKTNQDKTEVQRSSLGPYRFWAEQAKIANTPCRSVTGDMIKADLDRLREARKIANSTVNRHLVALQGSWTLMLKRDGMDMENKPRKVNKLKEEYLNTMAYTDEELALIFAALKIEDAKHREINIAKDDNGSHGFAHLEPLARLASVTGIRRTALAELKVDEIYLDGPNKFIWKKMKGNTKKRVPLTDDAALILERLIRRAQNGFVFHTLGNPPKSTSFERFEKIIRSLDGVRHTPKPFHSFRAHVATKMFENGASTAQIGTMLGISDKVAAGYINRSVKGDDALKNFISPPTESDKPPSKPRHLKVVKP